MTYTTLNESGCFAEISSFSSANGSREFHIMLHASSGEKSFLKQLDSLHQTLNQLLTLPPYTNTTVIFRRYFLSDIANQEQYIKEKLDSTANHTTSLIQQPPLDGSKVALWVYLSSESQNGYTHFWTMNKYSQKATVEEQSTEILTNYNTFLHTNNCTLKDNCIRTWFYVQDVDTNYAGFVTARKAYFEDHGLTNKTHYIASTGIEGKNASPQSLVTMDAYAIQGINPQQIRHLHALTHLSPTHIYGVTFERGTTIQYGDRQHIFISGTASIDNQGKIVHANDVVAQTSRMWENIDALLAEANATTDDIAHAIVYLRDTGDYQIIERLFEEQFPRLPIVITLAPVCRPGWLIEMECIAINDKEDKQFRDF